jgi:predicted MFS family arabinose efflux permease
MLQQIREGWRYVIAHPLMRPMMIDATATNFACGMLLALTPLYLVRELGASPTAYGVVLAGEGLGALAGAAVGPRLSRTFGTGRILLAAAVLSIPSVLLMPLGRDGVRALALFALGNALFAFFTVILSVITRTYRQQESPPELLARVMATVRFVSWGVIPLGGLLAGWIAHNTSARSALWLLAIVVALSPIVLFTSPLRHRRDILT